MIKNHSLAEVIPNEANSSIDINVDMAVGNEITIEIINTRGKVLFYKNIRLNSGPYMEQIDLMNFSEGTYFIRLENGKRVQTEKIIIS